MESSLFDKRLLYVTGKGGVGKTTVAAGLGLAAAARGRRTLVCEVADQDRVARGFGSVDGGEAEVQVDENLWATSIDPTRALEDWLSRQLGSPILVRTLGRSQAFQYFVAAAPGAKELITVGKLWDLSQGAGGERDGRAYDLVVVDAPASGHGVAMLRTPETFGEIARVGTVRRQAHKIRSLLSDPGRTAYLAVSMPEETPVNETLELERDIEEAVGVPLDTVIVNRLAPRRFSDAEAERLRAALTKGHDATSTAALRAALGQHERSRGEQQHLARLHAGTAARVVTLPFVPEAGLGQDTYRRLAGLLAEQL